MLNAKPDRYSEHERSQLAEVQRATQAEIERYRKYESAEKVVRMFKDDLNSEPAKRIHRELHQLGLPALDGVRDEFLDLAERLSGRGKR